MRWIPKKIEQDGGFKRSLKNIGLREEEENFLVESIHFWLLSESDLLKSTPSNKLLYHEGGKYVFVVKIPNPARKQGKSGGFRLIMLYNTKENIAKIGKIFRRTDLNYKGSSGKYQKEYDRYLADLCDTID